MSVRRLVVSITFLAVFAMAARISMDTDTWWHLRAGQWIIENRAIPQNDPFSYTRAGETWQYPGWLVEVPMYLIYRWAGAGGLNIMTAIMVTLAFIFVWLTLSGGTFLRAFVIILAATVSGVYWAARPYLVTFVLSAVYLWILDDFHWRHSTKAINRLWWLPVLMVIWANCHGGFIAGFLLWGVYLLGEVWSIIAKQLIRLRDSSSDKHFVTGNQVQATRDQGLVAGDQKSTTRDQKLVTRDDRLVISDRQSMSYLKRLLLIGILMLLAVCINPSGPVMLLYPIKTISIGALQDYIQEWQSPNFHSISVQPFAWLLLLTLGVAGASRRRLALTDFLLVAGFAYLGLLAGRNVALFSLVAPPVLTRHAAPLLDSIGRMFGFRVAPSAITRPWLARLNILLLIIIVLAVAAKIGLILPATANEKAFQKYEPVEAVGFIQTLKPPGRLFNSYNWGAYLLWMLPEYPVFIDGRTDLYNGEIINQWIKVVRADDGWQEVLNHWQVRLILLEPSTPVVDHLEGEGWRLYYRDEKAVVYGK